MHERNAADAGREPTGYVALVGNLSDGYRVVGPFANFDNAALATEGRESWIMPMYAALDGDNEMPTIQAVTNADVPPAPVYTVGNLTVDVGAHEALVDGKPVQLSPRAFAVLAVLARHPGRAFTREQLLALAWTQDGAERVDSDRTVDVHIRRLRSRIGDDAIGTVTGIGYRLNRPEGG